MSDLTPTERRTWFDSLETGELVLVRYGSDGTQLAQVERKVRGNPEKCWVRKFLANSRRWTNPVQIRAGDLVSPSSERGRKAKPRIVPKALAKGTPLPVVGFQRDLGFEAIGR